MYGFVLLDLLFELFALGIASVAVLLGLLLQVAGDLLLIALLLLHVDGVLRVVALVKDAFDLWVYLHQLLEIIRLGLLLVGQHLHETPGIHSEHARLGNKMVLYGVVTLITELHFLEVQLDAHIRNINIPQGYVP
jgi:hypothetical protein